MKTFWKYLVFAVCLIISVSCAKKSVDLGTLPAGAKVSFIHNETGTWGIDIKGSSIPDIGQMNPVKLEIYQLNKEIQDISVGYKTVKKSESGITAKADIRFGKDVVFHVKDLWTLNGQVVSLQRNIEVTGKDSAGFSSAIVLNVDSTIKWTDINCMAPGALYGDPTYDGDRSPGGTQNYKAKKFMMREDILPAPLFGLSFSNKTSVAILDPAPQGATTEAETRLTKDVMTDSRFLFGSLGAWQKENSPVEFGFVFPGKTSMSRGGPNAPAGTREILRYHPIEKGVVHNYQVSFRFGQDESFPEMTRNAWRWAWNTLKPPVYRIDVEQMRTILLDHLLSTAATINGRTAIPFVLSSVDTSVKRQWNWTMVAMGFVGKNIECADQLLREGDRDKTERGQKMRKTGLAIISSLIKALPTVPLTGTGYDLATGKPWDHVWVAPWLRNATEDMRVLMRAYRREKALGRMHPEWFNWMKQYIDWLMKQQREDGSFPRRWEPGKNVVVEPTGTTSYCPVPLLIMMTEETGDPKYKEAAIRAADYIWTNWGQHGLFIGGASDNPNITDKEAGMLSMEAFLSLYESTKESKWLDRAKAAGDFTESWIWIWNIPMPIDAKDSLLNYKKGVPTIGFQGITAAVAGSVDEYLDWAVPSYAKLYSYSKDEHYLDVARILLHDTKSMVALPGRLYDLAGPGWQQEGWRMGPGGGGRGTSGHRFWLPWVSANHLYGITGLEDFDPALFKQLAEGR
jgi:hypothetical protein